MSTAIITTTASVATANSSSPKSISGSGYGCGGGGGGNSNNSKMSPPIDTTRNEEEDCGSSNSSSSSSPPPPLLSKSITPSANSSSSSSSSKTVVNNSSSSSSSSSYNSNSSSLESLNSATSSNSSNSSNSSASSIASSNGSSSVAVKAVAGLPSKMLKATAAPFVSKMKADAAPFVPGSSRSLNHQTNNIIIAGTETGNGRSGSFGGSGSSKSHSYPSPPPPMTMAMTMTMTSSTERLPASSACLVPDSVPVNVNGIIEHLTRYCPEEGPGISSRLISVKGEYFYATSTTTTTTITGNGNNGNEGNGRNGKRGSGGNFSPTKQFPATSGAVVPVVNGNGNGNYKGGKGNNGGYQGPRGRSNPNQQKNHQKNRHFSGPTSPTIPVQHHHNDLYPCALCPSANGHSSPHCSGGGADLREGREARDAFLRSRSLSALSASGKGPIDPKGLAAVISLITSASEHLLLPFKLRPIPRSLSLAECAFLYCNYRKRKSSVYNLTDENGNHIITSGRSAFDMHDTRFDVLTYDQVLCLQEVLGQVISIQTDPEPGVGELVSFPLMDLVMAVRERLLLKGVALYDIRLNGGAASYVLSLPATSPSNGNGSGDKQSEDEKTDKDDEDEKAAAAAAAENAAAIAATRHYNDIDLIFSVDLPTAEEYELVREAVLEVLLALMPKQQQQQQQQTTPHPHHHHHHHHHGRNHRRAIEHLVNKMVKVEEPQDRWSLISLVNSAGRNVELKFVDTMRRQYEFSVDSFQIVLDTLLAFCSFFVCSSVSKQAAAEKAAAATAAAITSGDSSSSTEPQTPETPEMPHRSGIISLTRQWESLPITANFYPTVVGESMYGNFTESLVHLHHRLIVTKNPEEIRGGGLLKYISLLVRDYAPIDEDTITLLEPYMCTRFLIDFIYQDRHRDKLTNYLETHFEEDTLTKYNFLIVLQATVRRSSSLASHHSEALVIFEELILETYIQLLLDFLHLYVTDGGGLQDFYGRAVGARLCLCSKGLNRTCHHRYLAPLYCLTAPLVVTYVEDVYQPSASAEERRSGLAAFIDAHDELFPFYGGYTFAFLPSALFDTPLESNHYVVSSSTLKGGVPGSSVGYVPADPPSPTDFMCTFLMKTSSSAPATTSAVSSSAAGTGVTGTNVVPGTGGNFVKIIPLGVQELLPKSFYPVDAGERLQNFITPALASHLFLPITPPPAYRLCIVNRVPVYHSATIASGPIYHSAIFSAHAHSAPPLPTIPAGVTVEPLYAHARAHSTYGQNLVHFNHPHAHHLPPHHPHHPHHPNHPHHHHHHHHHHPHGALSLYQPISPYPQSPPSSAPIVNTSFSGRGSSKKASTPAVTSSSSYYSTTPHGQNNSYHQRGGNIHHHNQYQNHHNHQQQQNHPNHPQHPQHPHHPQHPNHPYSHPSSHPNHYHNNHHHHQQHPVYQHSVSMPAGDHRSFNGHHNCSEVMTAAHYSRNHNNHNHSHNHQQHQQQQQQQPEVEPLRIVYPRMPFDQAAKLFPLTPQALFPGCTTLMQVDGTIIATTTPPLSHNAASAAAAFQPPPPPLVSSVNMEISNDKVVKVSTPPPMTIPQISINDSLINLTSEGEWPAPGEQQQQQQQAVHGKGAPAVFSGEPETSADDLPPPTTLVELYSRSSSYSAAANPYCPAKLLVNKATNTSPVKRKVPLPVTVPTAAAAAAAAASVPTAAAVTVASTA